MIATQLPPHDEMMAAIFRRDPSYDGVFITAVTTTGIFCRPTCPARKPRPENIEFYSAPADALVAGFNEAFRQLFGDPPSHSARTIVQIHRIRTPLGPMVAGATDDALCLLEFGERRLLDLERSVNPATPECALPDWHR